MAKLYFSYSTMNAGKSTMLLQASYNYVERGMRTLLFTSALYAEGDVGVITSRIGICADAECSGAGDDLFERVNEHMQESKVDCVFVDEAQFLDRRAGLAAGPRRRPARHPGHVLRPAHRFPGQAVLRLAGAAGDRRRAARGADHLPLRPQGDDGGAARPGRQGRPEGEQVAIGKDAYVSLCRRHWEEEIGRLPPEDFVGFTQITRKSLAVSTGLLASTATAITPPARLPLLS